MEGKVQVPSQVELLVGALQVNAKTAEQYASRAAAVETRQKEDVTTSGTLATDLGKLKASVATSVASGKHIDALVSAQKAMEDCNAKAKEAAEAAKNAAALARQAAEHINTAATTAAQVGRGGK